MARRLIGSLDVAQRSLDQIAWNPGPRRKPLDESVALMQRFVDENPEWIIEGCYGDLVEAALPYCKREYRHVAEYSDD
jgi:hypothetical protein